MKHLTLLLALSLSARAATLPRQWQIEDKALVKYFQRETRALSENCLTNLSTREDWNARAPELRRQLAEMLGLAPMPARTELKATITKRFEQDSFTVENLHFQSRPGLYVTANLYVPKNLTKPAPTVLYVCGHSPVVTNKTSYGTKVAYQHWGSWFARNGYVCLVIDTLESGEILGNHHGTYRDGMWWWNSRGYTPGGVETWNGIRALDYLCTRPEVDTNRFGITGRSGGGAYSWYVTAMDDRIKAAAPTAGITDLENYVVDGAVEGHCDCMFFVNTYRWDYPQLAALAAPRPLLICNTDDDNIFPLDGVVRLRDKVRSVYDLLGAGEKCGLVITPGPHKDTQELQVPVMRWFNHYLKGEDSSVENFAAKLFTPQQLKVFDALPADAVNTNIHATFVDAARAEVPASKAQWNRQRDQWLAALREKCFRAWPVSGPAQLVEKDRVDWGRLMKLGDGFESIHYSLQLSADRSLILDVDRPRNAEALTLRLPSNAGAAGRQVNVTSHIATAKLSFPRGSTNDLPAGIKKDVQIRRRYMLLGETADSRRVWEIVRAIEAMRASKEYGKLRLRLEAESDMAVNALYASLFAPVDELVLTNLPRSHTNGPDYLNVMRILDVPQTVAMASQRSRVELRGVNEADWQFATQAARVGGFEQNLRITR